MALSRRTRFVVSTGLVIVAIAYVAYVRESFLAVREGLGSEYDGADLMFYAFPLCLLAAVLAILGVRGRDSE